MDLSDAFVQLGASLARGNLGALCQLSQLMPRNLDGPGFKFAVGLGERIVEASLKLRSDFRGETLDKLLSFGKSLLGVCGEGLDATGNFFGATTIDHQLFFPACLQFGEARGRQLVSLEKVVFPAVLDFGQSVLNRLVELSGKRSLHGLLRGQLELAL